MQRCLDPKAGKDVTVVVTEVYREIVKSRRERHSVYEVL